MPSINVNISSGADDGNEYHSGGSARNYFYSSTFVSFGRFSNGVNYSAFRFQTINIPQGSTINSATLTFKKKSSFGTTSVKIYGNNADDSPAWGAGNRVRNITKTAASTNLDLSATSSNDVTAIVQEIVNRGGWIANNNMAFGGFNQVASGSNFFLAYAYEKGGANIPNLSVTYSGATPTTRKSDFFSFFH